MKRAALLLCIWVLGATGFAQSLPTENLEVQGIPEIPQTVIEKTSQYVDMRSTGYAGWNRLGEGMYVTTRLKNTNQIYFLAAPGGELEQVTDFEEPVRGISQDRRKGKNGFIFMKDVGGGETYQMNYFDRSTGKHHMISDGKSRYSGPTWTESGSWIAFSSNKRNGKDTDVWMMNPDKPEEAKIVTKREGAWYAGDWSPDESKLLVVQYVSANISRAYIVDIASGEMKSLRAEAKGDVSFGGVEWGKEGKTVYYTSDEEGEYKSLYSYDVATGNVKPLVPGSKWDVGGFNLSHDKNMMAYVKNEDGLSVVHLVDMNTMKDEVLSNLPIGLLGSASFDMKDENIAFTIYRPVAPGDIYTMNLKTRKLTRWTNSAPDDMGDDKFVEPRLIHYPTFDKVEGKQREIPAFVFTPKSGVGKIPVIIDIHGGPEGQVRPWFSSTTQYYVNELNCAVIQPNVRGSSGYGKSYLLLDNGFKREHSVQDIGALLDWIATQPNLDKDRVAVSGGSYGGYMVLASMATYPDRIKCGVDNVGISNFVTFLKNTGDYRRDLRRVEYGDERDPEMEAFLQKISPTNNAHKISSPLFVAQGENDPRVPASEARQIITMVEKNDVPVWYLFAKDEGHGFAKKNNRDYYTRAKIMFFKKYLMK
jgi:dipeptidyl aminopeptidase/acylaminoacyl peptidase